jgi:phage shock protein C
MAFAFSTLQCCFINYTQQEQTSCKIETLKKFLRIWIRKERRILMTTEPKRLYRSRHDRMIGGVCGGIANHFNTDPTIIRLLFVLGLLVVGGTFWAYIIMMIIIPEEPTV